MKTFTTYIILSIISFSASGQSSRTNFQVTIDEMLMLGNSYYVITSDSIIVRTKLNLAKPRAKEFNKALSKDEGLKLKELFSRIDLTHLKDSYIGEDVSDDNYEFEFTFKTNQTEKKTRIYEYKHKEIFEFVREVNLLLDEDFAIHYDERYCKTNAR